MDSDTPMNKSWAVMVGDEILFKSDSKIEAFEYAWYTERMGPDTPRYRGPGRGQ